MNDSEKLAILKFIQMWQRSIGLHRVEVLNQLMSMLIPIEAANACLETLIADGLIEQSRMTSLLTLTPKAILWIRIVSNQRDLLENGRIASATAMPIAEQTPTPKKVKWLSVCKKAMNWCIKHIWTIILGALGSILAAYIIFKYHLFQ